MSYIKYIDCIPGGNKTALVMGDRYDADDKKRINDAIMAGDPEIEQVGFVQEINGAAPETSSLQMAGGEFCGNATRSAAFYYLNGQPGELTMTVSGGNQVSCGVNKNGDAWCEIPLGTAGLHQIETVADGIHKVSLSGITHLVLEPETASPYLNNLADLKSHGLAIIEKYGLMDAEAAGAIFLERLEDGRLKIHPIVRVRDIDSLFYETACGSGTVAAAMVLAQEAGHSLSAEIVQPSGMSITAEITVSVSPASSAAFTRAVISGPVVTDLTPKSIEI